MMLIGPMRGRDRKELMRMVERPSGHDAPQLTMSCLCTAFAGLLTALLALAQTAQAETLIVDGVSRGYEIFIPESAVLPARAMVVLHGGGGTAGQVRGATDFDDLATEAGFVAIYPDSAFGLWNDGRDSPHLADQQASAGDDVGFIVSLVDMLADSGVIDARQVGVAGISNGGMMTLRLACEAPQWFAAFAVVAANVAQGIECPGGQPVPMMFIHGSADPLIFYGGGPIASQFGGSRGTALSVEDSLALWAQRNGCAGRVVHAVVDERRYDSTAATVFDYTGCRANLRHILIEGMGHAWPGVRQGLIGLITGRTSMEIDGNRAIWAFVTAQFPG